MFKQSYNRLRLLARLASVSALLLLIMEACGVSQKISIRDVRSLTNTAKVESNKEIGIAFEVDNPDNLPLTYEWIAAEGTFKQASKTVKSVIYVAPGTLGTQLITVQAKHQDQVVAEGAIQIEVVASSTVSAPPPPPTATATPTPPPTATATPTPPPTATATPTPPPTPTTPPCQLVSVRPPLSKPAADLKAEILAPQPCSIVSVPSEWGGSIPGGGGGTYEGNLEGRELWILIYPSDQKYYPQTPNACESLPAQASEGRWATPIGLGGPPQQYDIVVTVTSADSEASQVFKRWLEAGCRSKSFPGFSKLPAGLTELTAITVKTKGP